MSWEFVFNTAAKDKWWQNIDEANKAAKDCGYEFFTWNGWVYAISGERTGVKVKDCF